MTSLVHVISSSSTDAKLGKDLEEAAAILSQLWSNLKVEKALVSKATNWMKVYTMPGHVTYTMHASSCIWHKGHKIPT